MGHVTNRAGHVPAFLLRQQRMAGALEQPDVGVVSNDYVQVPVGADFLKKTHVTRMQPIVATGNDDFLARRRPAWQRLFGKTSQLLS